MQKNLKTKINERFSKDFDIEDIILNYIFKSINNDLYFNKNDGNIMMS